MDSSFSNSQIEVSSLPRISDIEFKGLHKDYLTVELIGSAIFWFISGSGASVAIAVFWGTWPSWLSWLALGSLISIILSSFILTILGFKRKKYALREHDIIYKTGLIWRSTTILPFNRIQHAEVQQGPVDRLFNLSKLKIYTAGGSGSDLSISGLVPDEANAMKHFILNKTSANEEE